MNSKLETIQQILEARELPQDSPEFLKQRKKLSESISIELLQELLSTELSLRMRINTMKIKLYDAGVAFKELEEKSEELIEEGRELRRQKEIMPMTIETLEDETKWELLNQLSKLTLFQLTDLVNSIK